ncbi:MAG: DUF4178 domain-containing protein [Bdellovibrionales bacterium]|nr:DUF4178 domain-containing protein [Bdellovibrionales bacterium]
MTVQQYNCPTCGAPLPVENRFSLQVICSYCGQSSRITPQGLDPSGEKALLADFPSILSIGATGMLRGTPFKVLGMLRFKYDGGFWDEWFLALDTGKKLWLQEDEGEFTAFEKEQLTSPVPPFEEMQVGSLVPVNGKQFFIMEKRRAVLAGGRGELTFVVTPHSAVGCVDGNAGGILMSIEYLPDEINLSWGAEVPLEELQVDAP